MSATKKRFTDTSIWDNDWFCDLPTNHKLAWFFIKDDCDHAGIWKTHKRRLISAIGEQYDLEDIAMYLNSDKERIYVLDNGYWFVCGFFSFQYGEVMNLRNKVHKSINDIYCSLNVPLIKTGIKHIIDPRFNTTQLIDSQNAGEVIMTSSKVLKIKK